MSFPVKYVGCPNPMSNSEIDRKIHSLVAYDMRLFAILYPVNVSHHLILSPPAAECELLCDIYCYFMQVIILLSSAGYGDRKKVVKP